jgi:hypothetical protein
VSLIQFNGEPFLEFSFRAHNCITNLLEDISDTSYINGASDISRALEKAVKFAYTKPRVTFLFEIFELFPFLGRSFGRAKRYSFDSRWPKRRECSSSGRGLLKLVNDGYF